IPTSGVGAQLLQNVKTLGEVLNNCQTTGSQRELALMKVTALTEVFYFINMYPLWSKTPRSAEKRFNHWCKPLNLTIRKSERTIIKQTKERVESKPPIKQRI